MFAYESAVQQSKVGPTWVIIQCLLLTFEIGVGDELLDALLLVDLGLVVGAVLRDEEDGVLEVLQRGALRVHQVPVQHVQLKIKYDVSLKCPITR